MEGRWEDERDEEEDGVAVTAMSLIFTSEQLSTESSAPSIWDVAPVKVNSEREKEGEDEEREVEEGVNK